MSDDPSLLQQIADNLDYVRGRVDAAHERLTGLQVSVEHRLTKLEVRAGLIALAVSAAVSIAAAFGK